MKHILKLMQKQKLSLAEKTELDEVWDKRKAAIHAGGRRPTQEEVEVVIERIERFCSPRGTNMPPIRGRFYAELEGTGRAKRMLQVLFWFGTQDGRDYRRLDLLEALRIYLESWIHVRAKFDCTYRRYTFKQFTTSKTCG